jgi:hypothetical protein
MGLLFFMAGAINKFEWAHYLLSQMLPMSLNGPIYIFWQLLPISLNGLIIFMSGATNKIECAYYFS